MWLKVAEGIAIPFIGTALGSACVFFMKKQLSRKVQRALTGFAGGVMVAASIWSLLIPAMNQCADKGRLAFLPAFIGFWLGIQTCESQMFTQVLSCAKAREATFSETYIHYIT